MLRRDPSLVTRLTALVARHAEVHVADGPEALAGTARRVMAGGDGPVVLCGGDGTYLASITALHAAAGDRPLPPVVLARAGSVSIVARNFTRRERLLDTVRRVVAAPERLRYAERPTIRVVADEHAHTGFTFGTGLVASFFDEYEARGAGGNATALRIAAHVFASSLGGGPLARRILGPLPCRLVVEGTELRPAAYSLVLCSVLRDVGLHHLVAHRAGEDPSRPHLVATPLPPALLGPQWPLVLLGRPLLGRENFDGLVTGFEVRFDGGAGPYVLDGDTFRARRVRITAGPTLRVAL